MKFAKTGSKFPQILKSLPNIAQGFFNFCKSGEIWPNLVTLFAWQLVKVILTLKVPTLPLLHVSDIRNRTQALSVISSSS